MRPPDQGKVGTPSYIDVEDKFIFIGLQESHTNGRARETSWFFWFLYPEKAMKAKNFGRFGIEVIHQAKTRSRRHSVPMISLLVVK